MNQLIFERTWEDCDMFQIKVTAQSDTASASRKLYIQEDKIAELSSNLQSFPNKLSDRYHWEAKCYLNEPVPSISLDFRCEDKAGHIIIEAFVSLEDGAPFGEHTCRFFIRTEPGLLNDFGKALTAINETGIGQKALLHP